MELLKQFVANTPEWASDVRLSFESLERSKLDPQLIWGCALAAAVNAGDAPLAQAIEARLQRAIPGIEGELQAKGARTAAGLMAMTNYLYSFRHHSNNEAITGHKPVGLSMKAYPTHAGVSKKEFEAYALAASVVGKCQSCISGHVAALLKEGLFEDEVHEIGRIASVVGAMSKIMAFF